MKKFILVVLCLLCIAGPVSAYGLYVTCPDSVQVGLPLKCSIDSDFPPGTSFNVVLYQTQYTATQIQSEPVTVQDKAKTLYKIFDTQGLPGGDYKVEVKFIGADEPRLRSDSITLRLVKIIDRSDELTITSPKSQNIDEALRIEGSLKNGGSDGIQLEVRDPDGGRIFGPQWIGTTSDIRSGDGKFTQKIAVKDAGNYEVSFADSKGFISTATFKVGSPTPVATAVIPTTNVVKTVKTTTAVPTPWPTATQSPLSPFVGIGAVMLAGLLAAYVIRK
ncbi:hypothetical protein [uncultured Methanoregula sp.]|uniref:hypothetical protein n=1 Tax=uncultured Methanoregula sp. TaxID=1005933 RepID=UPI002AAB4DF8|nr:hypothetical protein [uncultured Methanoregula sp.]